jgi:exonuclease III
VRLVSWNIRAGGGVRAEHIAAQLHAWQTDIAVLQEFRGTAASTLIATRLAESGLHYQRNTVDHQNPAVNSLLIASRWPLRRVRLGRSPDNPRRWLHVNVAAPVPFALMGIHIPNRATGLKYPFMQAITDIAGRWRGPPAIIAGDTNSGRIGIDEESLAFNKIEDTWLQELQRLRWTDIYRHQSRADSPYTWYSPNGRNGFRLDQMFLEPRLLARQSAFYHRWGGDTTARLETLSDHAAMLLDID